jgi:hypothetical protein
MMEMQMMVEEEDMRDTLTAMDEKEVFEDEKKTKNAP